MSPYRKVNPRGTVRSGGYGFPTGAYGTRTAPTIDMDARGRIRNIRYPSPAQRSAAYSQMSLAQRSAYDAAMAKHAKNVAGAAKHNALRNIAVAGKAVARIAPWLSMAAMMWDAWDQVNNPGTPGPAATTGGDPSGYGWTYVSGPHYPPAGGGPTVWIYPETTIPGGVWWLVESTHGAYYRQYMAPKAYGDPTHDFSKAGRLHLVSNRPSRGQYSTCYLYEKGADDSVSAKPTPTYPNAPSTSPATYPSSQTQPAVIPSIGLQPVTSPVPIIDVQAVPYGVLPYLADVTATRTASNGQPRRNPPRPSRVRTRPSKGVKETKHAPVIKGALAIIANAFTEGADVTDALHDALPPPLQCGFARGGVGRVPAGATVDGGRRTLRKPRPFSLAGYTRYPCTPQQKALTVYRHINMIDWTQAVQNLIAEQQTDRVAGKAGRFGAKANRGLGLSVGVQVGPAL